MGFTSKIVLMFIAVLLLITPPVSSSDNAHRPNDDDYCDTRTPTHREGLSKQDAIGFDACHTYNNEDHHETAEESHMNDEIRIVLIGRTGSGKSLTGNTILGDAFFKSDVGAKFVTKKSKLGFASRFGRRVHVVDTPGLFDTGMAYIDVMKEIVKWIAITSPGPHAFVLVTRVDRFTQEEQDTVEHLRKLFGKEMNKYLFVLFTRKDDLDRVGKDIHTFVKSVPKSLQQLIKDCDRRYIGFNNVLPVSERDDQVKELLDLIDANIRNNGGKYYTNHMYKEAEKMMLIEQREIMEQLEKESTDIEEGPQSMFGAQIEMLKQEIHFMKNLLKKHSENEDQPKLKRKIERTKLQIARERAREKAEDEESSFFQNIWEFIKKWILW